MEEARVGEIKVGEAEVEEAKVKEAKARREVTEEEKGEKSNKTLVISSFVSRTSSPFQEADSDV